MITFFIGEGRLGNQIFQYLTIRALFKNSAIFTPNLSALNRIFKPTNNLKLIRLPKPLEQLLRKIITPCFIRPLFKWLRVGTYCVELDELLVNGATGSSGKVKITNGLLPIVFFDGGYFQNFNDLLKPEYFRALAIRDEVIFKANALLETLTTTRAKPEIVMHVRRGDYIGHVTYGLNDVVLNEDYYKQAIQSARDYLGYEAVVLIVTDDANWCQEFLADTQPFIVVSSSEAVDFALLSMFRVVILSNSTFSLAAACVSNCAEYVIGPKFWFGHYVGEWYPPRIRIDDKRFVYL